MKFILMFLVVFGLFRVLSAPMHGGPAFHAAMFLVLLIVCAVVYRASRRRRPAPN